MNAKKCDRCGKYYETENSVTIQYVYGQVKFVPFIGLCPEKTTYDLCADCAEEFQEWMNSLSDDTLAEQVAQEPHGTE